MPPRARVKEQDQALLDIPVVDDVAPVIDDDAHVDVDRFRFAALDVDRFRFAAVTDQPPAAPDADRFTAAAGRLRFVHSGRFAAKPGRKLVRQTVLVLPPLRTEGDLLWIPAAEFEQCFEWVEDEVWQLGSVVDFGMAVESMKYMHGYDDDDDDVDICVLVIADESEAQTTSDWWDTGEGVPPELMEQALSLRAGLAKDPVSVAGAMEIGDLIRLERVAGLPRVPMPLEVADAIANDPTAGLGGAALDHAVWRMAGLFGPPGARFAQELEIRSSEEFLRLSPTENFFLRTESLPPGATPVRQTYMTGRELYAMSGRYVVSKASYVSAPDGEVIGGWRSCWLEPLPTRSELLHLGALLSRFDEDYPERS